MQKELGALLTPPSGEQVESWTGLETARQLQIRFDDTQRYVFHNSTRSIKLVKTHPFSTSTLKCTVKYTPK